MGYYDRRSGFRDEDIEDPEIELPAVGKRTRTGRLVQRKGVGAATPDATVAGLPEGGGAPLDPAIRDAVGNATGTSLGDVRVHTGAASAGAAAALGARAFTIGNDIHLAGDASPADRHLMAHEATHTLHQRGTAGGVQTKLAVSMPGDALEHEADRVADAALSGGTATVSIGAATGTIQRETDKRLGYPTGGAGDSESKGLDAKTLPYDAPGCWNAQEILSKLTQVDEDPNTTTDQVRCGANAVLAIAINNGPPAVDKLVAGTIAKGNALAGDPDVQKDPKKAKRASDAKAAVATLAAPQAALLASKATYHDLSVVANAMKLVIAADPQGATTGHEVLDAQAMVGKTHEGGYEGDLGKGGTRIRDREHLKQLTDKLEPGDAYTLNVDTDELDRSPDRPISLTNEVNHFVTLGKERWAAQAGGKPRIFLYDPYPREGKSQYMYSDKDDFWYLFTDKNGTWKSILLVGTTKAP